MIAFQQDLAAAAATHQFVAKVLEARATGIGAEKEGGDDKESGELQRRQEGASLKGSGFSRAEWAMFMNCHSEQARAKLAKRARREEPAV